MARRSILLTVAFAIAALGTAMIIMYIQGIDARAADGQTRVQVLTATDVIAAGESVADAQAAGKFEKTEVVRADMVDGALSSTASIDNQVALGTIYPGQQIMGQQFVKPGSEVAIFAAADPEIYKPDGTTQKLAPYTRILLPAVQVIGVGDTSVTSRTTTDGNGQ